MAANRKILKIILANLALLFLVIISISLTSNFFADNENGIFSSFKIPNNLNDPRIKVEPESHDFLDIIKGTVVEYSFNVWNIGGSDLEILSVSTSCGCTKGWIDNEVIAFGEFTLLHVSFDPNAHNSVGSLKRIVYIKSNDPINPEIDIPIYVNVLE